MSFERLAPENSDWLRSLASSVTVALNNSPVLSYYYASSASMGSLGNFSPAGSSQPLLTTDGSAFIHGSLIVWQCQVWNFRLSYMRSFV